MKEYFQALLPSCCLILCLKKRRRDKDFEAARELLASEMDLVYLIRQVRYLSAAVKMLLPAAKAAEFLSLTEKVPVDQAETGSDPTKERKSNNPVPPLKDFVQSVGSQQPVDDVTRRITDQNLAASRNIHARKGTDTSVATDIAMHLDSVNNL